LALTGLDPDVFHHHPAATSTPSTAKPISALLLFEATRYPLKSLKRRHFTVAPKRTPANNPSDWVKFSEYAPDS
jgi:hypothetical protein